MLSRANQELMERIIPPMEYEERNGFDNKPVLDNLGKEKLKEIENELLRLLDSTKNEVDDLIVSTLTYIKSEKCIPIFNTLLERDISALDKILLSSAIFELNSNVQSESIAIENFQSLSDDIQMISAFYYLSKFNTKGTRALIQKYVDNDNYLLAYNARRFLNDSNDI